MNGKRLTRLGIAIGLPVVLMALSYAATGGFSPVRAGDDLPRDFNTPGAPVQAYLYFTDDKLASLYAEARLIRAGNTAADTAVSILNALAAGPSGSLAPVIPPETRLNAFYLTADGTGYADFSESIQRHHPGGCRAEFFSIYAVVNSWIVNIPEIRRVKLLIGGREAETLAGHMDLRHFYKADMMLIR